MNTSGSGTASIVAVKVTVSSSLTVWKLGLMVKTGARPDTSSSLTSAAVKDIILIIDRD